MKGMEQALSKRLYHHCSSLSCMNICEGIGMPGMVELLAMSR